MPTRDFNEKSPHFSLRFVPLHGVNNKIAVFFKPKVKLLDIQRRKVLKILICRANSLTEQLK